MKILLGNNHLVKTGGTENYTYALACQLQELGHEVEYFAFDKGNIAERLEQKGIKYMSKDYYDLILANHNTTTRELCKYGYVIQTCHGTIPELEQPSEYADKYVAITQEVKDHIAAKGYVSNIILNGIDCKRFSPTREVSATLHTVLSLCQSDEANCFLKDCCTQMGIELLTCNKHTNNVWDIEKEINKADLVVGIGRSIYDAMACGRCVISFDYRSYMGAYMGDGYLNADNIDKCILRNCSGRSSGRMFTKEEFMAELRKYNPSDSIWGRNYALQNLNIELAAKEYIALADERNTPQYIQNKLNRLRLLIKDDARNCQEIIRTKDIEIQNLQHCNDELAASKEHLARKVRILRKERMRYIIVVGLLLLILTATTCITNQKQ